jgi:hypothetical protein
MFIWQNTPCSQRKLNAYYRDFPVSSFLVDVYLGKRLFTFMYTKEGKNRSGKVRFLICSSVFCVGYVPEDYLLVILVLRGS